MRYQTIKDNTPSFLCKIISKYDYYLQGQLDLTIKTYCGCISELPDGRLVTNSGYNSLQVWSATGEPDFIFNKQLTSASCMAVLPDGRLVTGYGYNTIDIWLINGNAATLQSTLRGHSHRIYCIGILHDGRIVSGSADNTLKIWGEEGEPLTLVGHIKSVVCVDILPDGRIVSKSWDNSIKIWSTEGHLKLSFDAYDISGVRCLTVLPDGRIAEGGDNKIRIRSLTGQIDMTLEDDSTIICITTLPDGRIVSSGKNNLLKVWNPDTGLVDLTLDQGEGVYGVSVSSNRRIMSRLNGSIKIWK